MDMKKIALGSVALAAFGLMACNGDNGLGKTAAINENSTEDQKFAYMLGAQFGGQNFTIIPRQMGEDIYADALFQGIRDNLKANKDTNFKVQLNTDSLQALSQRYSAIARKRYEETRPDSAMMAEGDNDKIKAYIDSVARAQPITYKGACGKCKFNDRCGGCRARAAYYHDGDFMQEDSYCAYGRGLK